MTEQQENRRSQRFKYLMESVPKWKAGLERYRQQDEGWAA
jgi:hypothetical protein